MRGFSQIPARHSLAQAGGVAALLDDEHLANTLENNANGIAKMVSAFAAIGAETWPSFANFVWADLKQPAQPIFEALLRKGVIVRSGHVLGNPTCLRVTVGTSDEVEFFIEALMDVAGKVVGR